MVSISVIGQLNQYSIRTYNSENGLPQNDVVGVTIDKKNFIWVATQSGGICRYDGQNFRLYNIHNTPALVSYDCLGIYSLPDGSMKITDFAANITCNISNDYVMTAENTKTTDNRIAYNADRLFLYQGLVNDHNWPMVTKQPSVPSAIDKNLILGDHECYATISGNIYYLNNSNQTVLKLNAQNTSVKTHFLDTHFLLNNLFVGYENGRITAYQNGISQKGLWASKQAKSLIDSVSHGLGSYYFDGTSTFLVTNNSLYALRLSRDSILSSLLFRDKTFKTNDITSIKHEAVSGNIYIGTQSLGLYILSPISINTMVVGKNHNYNFDFVTAVVQLENGDLLSDKQRFNIYTRKTKMLSRFISTGDLLKCHDGTLLYMIKDTLTWSDQDMHHIYLQKTTGTRTWIIEDANYGFVWALYDDTLWKLYKNGKIERITGIKQASKFYQISTNILGVFTEQGLLEYDIAKNQLNEHPIMPNVLGVYIYCTRDGTAWIGTNGNGLYRYSKGKVVHMPLDNKMAMENVWSIYEDEKGYLWITTDRGLIQCLKSDLDNYVKDSTVVPYYYHYNRNDGLLTNEFEGDVMSPYALDKYGMLVYASTVGVAYFLPSSMHPLTVSGNILLESLSVDQKEVSISNNITLSPTFNRLKVFAVFSYLGNRENIIIEYNISGLNKVWYKLGENGEISIDRLPRGNYKIIVRKQNNFGTNNYQYAGLNFSVLPHFYETGWFYTLSVFTVILITALFFMFRTRSLRKKKQFLEKLVEIRTVELKESLNNLNITIEDLYKSEQKFYNANEVKEQAIAIILHDLKAPVRYLNMAAAGFKTNIEKLSNTEIIGFSKSFEQSTWQINEFVEELLQWLVLQQEDFKTTYSTVSILKIFSEIASLYKDIAALRGNVIIIMPELDNIYINTDHDILKLIIRNLVDNAVKHTNNGQILLSATKSDNLVTLNVKDNGTGMGKEKLVLLLDEKQNTETNLKHISSLGYGFVMRFLKLINGIIKMESELGLGTSVYCEFTNDISIKN